jgi:dihydropteroate synthase
VGVTAALRGFPGLGRTRVMGVVNVTPDSFSDGFADADLAVRHGLQLLTDGADLLDVGGESTRPGAERVPEREELQRVLPSSPHWPRQVPWSASTPRAPPSPGRRWRPARRW